MLSDVDVIIIGAGGGGAVAAKELGEKGLDVVLLEAGPWYGNKKWPHPNQEVGSESSSSVDDLSHELLERNFTNYEDDMNNSVTGKFRWGPADRRRSPWFRNIPQGGFIWQNAGVGGTTLHYFANSPRAYPAAIDGIWPISYREMIPYYEKVEATLPVAPAPITAKEELFFYGAQKSGWPLLKTLNVTKPGYRPQPNAILHPDPQINDPDFDFEHQTGCTLRGHCVNGCYKGPSVEKVAKRSTLVSYIPLALKTGNVKIRPNRYVTKILTEKGVQRGFRAVGVQYENTWTGETTDLRAKVIVLAAGAFETPRLWLNSQLPQNPWVGKGLSNHWFDVVSGIFDEKVLWNILGVPEIKPYVGQNSAARFDYPGLGFILAFGLSPGLYSSLLYGLGQSDSSSFYDFNEPWDIRGKVLGTPLKRLMAEYPRTLSMMILMNDEPNQRNGITLDPILKDEHGYVPRIQYYPCKTDARKRDQLAIIAADILKNAGAKKIIRSDWPPSLFIHAESTMRMGFVVDTTCESYQVERLFIADNSVLFDGLGGPNPTLTTQMLATRTAEKLAEKYFG